MLNINHVETCYDFIFHTKKQNVSYSSSVPIAAKLISYTVDSPPDESLAITQTHMQTIPESREAEIPPSHPLEMGPALLQHQEPIVDPESDQVVKPSSKRMSGSTSMDSLLSLSDVDFGMEEQTTGTEEVPVVDGPEVDGPVIQRRKTKVRSFNFPSGVVRWDLQNSDPTSSPVQSTSPSDC